MNWERLGYQVDDINSRRDPEDSTDDSNYIFKIGQYIYLILAPVSQILLNEKDKADAPNNSTDI